MKSLLIILIISLTAHAEDISPSKIKELSNKASDKGEVLEELKIFSKTGIYDIYMEFNNFKDKPFKVGPIPTTTKIANKNAIIYTTPLVEGGSYYMLLTYDKELAVYKKYLLGRDNKVVEMVGVSTDNKNIAWTVISPNGEVSLSQEKNTMTGSEWYSVTMKDGKIIKTEKGHAKLKK